MMEDKEIQNFERILGYITRCLHLHQLDQRLIIKLIINLDLTFLDKW